MKSLYRKLKSRAGESIGEVLIALLISSVALIMLAGMISASGRLISQSRTIMQDYYNSSEWHSTPSTSASIEVSENPETGGPATQSFGFTSVTLETGKLGEQEVYYYHLGGTS